MNIKLIQKLLILSMFILFNPTFNAHANQTVERGPGDIMLSPQEIEELQAMEQLVEQERSKMNPQQRAEFDSTVAELTKELEKMKPEELEAFISQVIFGQEPGDAHEAPEYSHPVPQPMAIETPAIIEEKTAVDDTFQKKQEELLAIIDSIISTSNKIISKISGASDFDSHVKQWIKQWNEQKKIKGWKASDTWLALKKQIEDCSQKLGKVKEYDAQGSSYLYLNQIINDPELFKNLRSLDTAIKAHEAKIEFDPLDLEAISPESKLALLGIINDFSQAFQAHNLLNALNSILQSQSADIEKEYNSQDKTECNNAMTEYKSVKKEEKKIVSNKQEKKEENPVDRLMGKLENSLDQAADAIKNSVLISIKEHLTNATDPKPNYDTATAYLPSAIKKIQTANGTIKAIKLNIKTLSETQQTSYINSSKSIYQKYKNYFDKVVSQTQWIKSNEKAIGSQKKIAFCGFSGAQKELYPASIYELQTAIQDLDSAIKTLTA